jgi:hypothetical protein
MIVTNRRLSKFAALDVCQVYAGTNYVIVGACRASRCHRSVLRARQAKLFKCRTHVESNSATYAATQTGFSLKVNEVSPSNRAIVRVHRVRLIRKLADFLNGVDLSKVRVGDVFDLTARDARMLIVEGCAELIEDLDEADEKPKKG